MTTSSTGGRCRNADSRGRRAFTLLELILVMALLVVVLSVGAPTLSAFFSGRTINSEAKRFLALTRLAQSQAVSKGVPMELWVDRVAGEYGLRIQEGYEAGYDSPAPADGQADRPAPSTKQIEFNLGEGLRFDLEQDGQLDKLVDCIRFQPDGSIDECSLSEIVIRQGLDDWVRVQLSDDAASYEIDRSEDVL